MARSPSPPFTPPIIPAKRGWGDCDSDEDAGATQSDWSNGSTQGEPSRSNALMATSKPRCHKRAREAIDGPTSSTPNEPEEKNSSSRTPSPHLVFKHAELRCGVRGCHEVLRLSDFVAARAHYHSHFSSRAPSDLNAPGSSRLNENSGGNGGPTRLRGRTGCCRRVPIQVPTLWPRLGATSLTLYQNKHTVSVFRLSGCASSFSRAYLLGILLPYG